MSDEKIYQGYVEIAKLENELESLEKQAKRSKEALYRTIDQMKVDVQISDESTEKYREIVVDQHRAYMSDLSLVEAAKTVYLKKLTEVTSGGSNPFDLFSGLNSGGN